MSRPAKLKDPGKLNLYLEKRIIQKARQLAKLAKKSIGELFSEFIEKAP